MIVAKITGGLGNQMFQYAVARNIQINNNYKNMVLDISSYDKDNLRNFNLGIFKLNNNLKLDNRYKILFKLNKIFNGKLKYFYRENQSMNYDDTLINTKNKKLYLDGYFQSYKYFEGIKDVLQDEFKIIEKINDKALEILKDIIDNNSVCIHIRRGDYVSDENANKKHGVCSLEYYEESIRKINELVSGAKFYIFSDDIEWVKENLRVKSAIYIDKYISKYDYEDFELMKNCKHFIIANSTFSWWAAWLSDSNEKVVIAPKNWFSSEDRNKNNYNLIPSDWITI